MPHPATTKVPRAAGECGLTSFRSKQQVRQQDGLVAVRTRCAWPGAPAEDPAIGAALLAEIPGVAGRTLVDGGRSGDATGDAGQGRPVPAAPGRLAAGRGAHPLAPHGREGAPTHRTLGRYAIITRRDYRFLLRAGAWRSAEPACGCGPLSS